MSCLLCLACDIPDLDHTLFSCTTNDDCAPGQVCERYQGDLACRRPLESSSLPLVDSQQFGVLVRSAVDLEGFIYLDEIRW